MTDNPNFYDLPSLVYPVHDPVIAAPHSSQALERGGQRFPLLVGLGFEALNGIRKLIPYGPIELQPVLGGLFQKLDFERQCQGFRSAQGIRL